MCKVLPCFNLRNTEKKPSEIKVLVKNPSSKMEAGGVGDLREIEKKT